MTVGGTVTYYVWAVAAPAFAISVRHTDPAGALWAGSAATLVSIAVLLFIAGTVSVAPAVYVELSPPGSGPPG
jgi:MHS family alpha-ketoglutarate permease-like MFS transporter